MALYHSYSGRGDGMRSIYRRPVTAEAAQAPLSAKEEAPPASCLGDCAAPARPAAPSTGGRYDCSDLASVSLAMVYSPCQSFSGLYSPEQGIKRGTLFSALDKPLLAKGGKR